MRKVFLFVAAMLLFLVYARSSFGVVTRFATCDACGLCPTILSPINGALASCSVDPRQVPGDWKSCVKCLYPTLYPKDSNPVASCDTVSIYEPPITPTNLVAVGRQFTLLGCITSGTSVGFDNGGKNNSRGAPSVVQALLNVIFSLSGGLAILYLMYGGFVVITSQADPERLNYGRRLIYGAIVGLIITLGSVFMVNLVGSGILRIPGFSGAV